jgi:hypothetical protein
MKFGAKLCASDWHEPDMPSLRYPGRRRSHQQCSAGAHPVSSALRSSVFGSALRIRVFQLIHQQEDDNAADGEDDTTNRIRNGVGDCRDCAVRSFLYGAQRRRGTAGAGHGTE